MGNQFWLGHWLHRCHRPSHRQNHHRLPFRLLATHILWLGNNETVRTVIYNSGVSSSQLLQRSDSWATILRKSTSHVWSRRLTIPASPNSSRSSIPSMPLPTGLPASYGGCSPAPATPRTLPTTTLPS